MNNSKTSGTSKDHREHLPDRLVLEIRGLGHVPSLKNNKRSIIQWNGKAKPITDPKVKKWMQLAVQSIVSQWWSGLATGGEGMQMVAYRPSWTASLPHDDAWTVIPEITIKSALCEPGQEGATIYIERI